MTKFFKTLILTLYYMPAAVRSAWNIQRKLLYPVKDESDGFLKFMLYLESEAIKDGVKIDESVQELIDYAYIELEFRNKWKDRDNK